MGGFPGFAPYAIPRNDRIADLIVHGGDIAARGALMSGQAWSDFARDMGHLAANTTAQLMQQREQRKTDEQLNSILSDPELAQDPKRMLAAFTSVLGPENGLKYATGYLGILGAAQKQQQGQPPTPEQWRASVSALAQMAQDQPGVFDAQWATNLRPHMLTGAQYFMGGYVPPEDPREVRDGLIKYAQTLQSPKAPQTLKTRESIGGKLMDVTKQWQEGPNGGQWVTAPGIAPVEAQPSGEKTVEERLAALDPKSPEYQRIMQVKRELAAAGREPQPADTDQPLSDAATDMAARRYLMDGTLPSFGMGKVGASNKKRVLERAAEIDPQANIAANAASYAGDKASLGAMQKQVDAVSAFESTAGKNAKMLDGLLDKIPNFGSTWANKPARALSGAMGSEDMTQFNVIRQSVANEYARILSNPGLSGVMSDSAREEGAVLLDPNATAGQIRAAIKALAAEAKNRHTEYQGQLDAIRGRMGGGGRAPAGGSSAAPKRVRFDAQGNIISGGQ